MRSLLPSALLLFPVAMALFGCGRSTPPPPPEPRDVTLSVPAMN